MDEEGFTSGQGCKASKRVSTSPGKANQLSGKHKHEIYVVTG